VPIGQPVPTFLSLFSPVSGTHYFTLNFHKIDLLKSYIWERSCDIYLSMPEFWKHFTEISNYKGYKWIGQGLEGPRILKSVSLELGCKISYRDFHQIGSSLNLTVQEFSFCNLFRILLCDYLIFLVINPTLYHLSSINAGVI
jgi:hypothetical protein